MLSHVLLGIVEALDRLMDKLGVKSKTLMSWYNDNGRNKQFRQPKTSCSEGDLRDNTAVTARPRLEKKESFFLTLY